MGELFDKMYKGPIVIIDNEVKDTESEVGKLASEFKKKKIAVIEYESMEEAKSIQESSLLDFVILDWKLVEDAEVRLGDEQRRQAFHEKIEFIERLRQNSLAPVFVITKADIGAIKEELMETNIAKWLDKAVFFSTKGELIDNVNGRITVVEKIEEWLRGNPHVYLAKWWTMEWLKKNTKSFWDLFEACPTWPVAFYKRFETDGVNPKIGLAETILNLVGSQISTDSLKDDIFNSETDVPTSAQIKELYIKRAYISHPDIQKEVRAGDIYIAPNRKSYYLNVRPDCDTTKRVTKPENIELYLVRGTIGPGEIPLDDHQIVRERVSQIVLPFLDGHEYVSFNMRRLTVVKVAEVIAKGYTKTFRLAQPFASRQQDRFSHFIGRQGEPAFPDSLWRGIEAENEGNAE